MLINQIFVRFFSFLIKNCIISAPLKCRRKYRRSYSKFYVLSSWNLENYLKWKLLYCDPYFELVQSYGSKQVFWNIPWWSYLAGITLIEGLRTYISDIKVLTVDMDLKLFRLALFTEKFWPQGLQKFDEDFNIFVLIYNLAQIESIPHGP